MEQRTGNVDHFLKRFFVPSRIRFLCGSLLACQISLFLYNVCVPGHYDRMGCVRGRDLLQFYLSGRIVAENESSRLYDNEFFLEKQNEVIPYDEAFKELRCRYFSLYPPTMALIFAPLARMPYDTFAVLGWIWTAVGYCVAARWIVRDLRPSDEWRSSVWLGVLGFNPALVMLWNCQFSWLWLLGFLMCFWLRRLGREFSAGICLSILTLKPHFAVVAAVWLLMKRAWWTLAGLFVGFAVQAILVASLLGPLIWQQYFIGARIYSQLGAIYNFSPDYQQAVLGTMQALLGGAHSIIAKLVYAVVVGVVLLLTFRVTGFRRKESPAAEPWQSSTGGSEPDASGANTHFSGNVDEDYRVEESTVILMVLLCVPHLLIYDLVLLLIPIGHLFGLHRDYPELFPAWPPILLYSLTMIAPIYPLVPGFSLIPCAMLLVQVLLATRRISSRPTVLHREASQGT